MDDTLFNDNVNQPVPNRADGYARMDDGSYEIFMTNLSWVGDGGVYTNLDDFMKWDQNFYNNRLGKSSDALIKLVTTPHPDTIDYAGDGPVNVQYAFGMREQESNGEFMIGHNGGWVAFSALYNRYPVLELSVVVFCNSTDTSAPELGAKVGEIAIAAIKSN
jgi:CubicO group peptidase (beta-lactamase class C family)